MKRDTGIGYRIKQARQERGWTQFRLHEESGLAVPTLSAYERGAKTPGIDQLRDLCRTLEVSPNWLLYGEPDPFGEVGEAQEEPWSSYFDPYRPMETFLFLAIAFMALPNPDQRALRTLIFGKAEAIHGPEKVEQLMGLMERLQPEMMEDIQKGRLTEQRMDELIEKHWPEVE